MPQTSQPASGSSGTTLISVVVPAYNAEAYIGATLRSVLAQSYGDFEVIVIDDCSTDATPGVVADIASADSRVRLIRLERNFGAPAGPRNVGVNAAKGDFIAFLDADDIWHPDKLRLQVEVLERTGSKFCSSKMVDFREEGDLVFTAAGDCRVTKIGFLGLLMKPRTPTSSVVVAADLVRRHPFNESPLYKAREDFDCWLRCHEEIGHSAKIQHPLIGYRVSSGQISGGKMLMIKRHLHVLKEYRLASGKSLGAGAYVFTATHFLLSVYYRLIRKEL